MIDIHCHIIAGVDDGAQHMDESVAMAKIAREDGCRHIVATPHFFHNCLVKRPIVEQKVRELQKRLDLEGIALTVHAGNEVRLESSAFVTGHALEENFCYLGSEKRYVLLEQTWQHYCPDSEDIVRWFIGRGVTPILPHPERHAFYREQPDLLIGLIRLGAWTQVSVDSMLGGNSHEALDFARWMAQEGHMHTIASDAHSTTRKPNISAGYRLLRDWIGEPQTRDIQQRIERIIAPSQ